MFYLNSEEEKIGQDCQFAFLVINLVLIYLGHTVEMPPEKMKLLIYKLSKLWQNVLEHLPCYFDTWNTHEFFFIQNL